MHGHNSRPEEEEAEEEEVKCYDPASSLRKRNDVQGKGWLDFNSLSLTNGSAGSDTKDDVSGTWTGGSKG